MPPGKQRLPAEHVVELQMHAPFCVLHVPPPPALQTAFEVQRQV
jgi:hypothetical protein